MGREGNEELKANDYCRHSLSRTRRGERECSCHELSRRQRRLVCRLFSCPCSHLGINTYTCNRASPRLKDATLSADECASLYARLILDVRVMFHQCKLVHADLSEYNILFHNNDLYIIDVSQSVEHDHPLAFDFLRNDIKNAEEFFGRLGVKTLGLRRCFEFVTMEKLSDTENDTDSVVLQRWLREAETTHFLTEQDKIIRGGDGVTSEHEDAIFLKSFIPRNLYEVYDPERDVARVNAGQGGGLIYAKTIGLVSTTEKQSNSAEDNEKPGKIGESPDEQEASAHKDVEDEVSSNEGEERSESGEDGGFVERKPRGHRHEDKEAKKVGQDEC